MDPIAPNRYIDHERRTPKVHLQAQVIHPFSCTEETVPSNACLKLRNNILAQLEGCADMICFSKMATLQILMMMCDNNRT
jgi:hypothetical protein